MTIETDIEAAIKALGYDVWTDTADLDTPLPYVTYIQVGGAPTNALCGNADGQNARIQFNVWAKRRSEANTMMRAIEAVLTEPPLRGVSLGSLVAEYNAPTKARGARQDISFWYRP